MRRAAAALVLLAALGVPERAYACLTCGNHGDQIATLCVYGAFMLTPFLLAGGIGYVIHRQLKQLQQTTGDPDTHPGLPAATPP